MEQRIDIPDRTRGHARQISSDDRRRAPMQRRSTRGPLDVDDPLEEPQSASTVGSVTSPIRDTPTKSSLDQIQPSLLSADSPIRTSRSISPVRPSADFSLLLRPTLYHSVSNTQIPPQFLQSPHQPDPDSPLETLLSRGHFRLAAASAANELTSDSIKPNETLRILQLYHIRLSCLLLTSHADIATQEARPLIDWLARNYIPRSQQTDLVPDVQIVPWDLRLLLQRLQAFASGDSRRSIMSLYQLGTECRASAQQCHVEKDEAGAKIWEVRLADLGLRVASELVEMGEFDTAIRHLDSLSPAPNASDMATADITVRKALLFFRIGNTTAAESIIASLPTSTDQKTKKTLMALSAMAQDNPVRAASLLSELHAESPSDELIANNLAVAHLYAGHLDQALEVLEALVASGQSFSELLFNIATMYELSTEKAAEKKLGLVKDVAGSGPREDGTGWERNAVEFKL